MTPPAPQAALSQARERLQRTRQALLQHMGHDRYRHAEAGPERQAHAPAAGADTWTQLRVAWQLWWRAHPGHLALTLAEPALAAYGRAHPLKLLALSAATGAALVLVRPWRRVSAARLLALGLRAAPLSELAAVLLHGAASPSPTSSSPPTPSSPQSTPSPQSPQSPSPSSEPAR